MSRFSPSMSVRARCLLAIAAAACAAWRPPACAAQETLPTPPPVYSTAPAAGTPPAAGGYLPPGLATPDHPAEETVSEVRIVGNDTIADSQVIGNITTRAGRPFDRAVVQRDVRRLANLGWFVDVKPLYEKTPQGPIVIFQVVERPTTRYVFFIGNKGVSDKKLTKETGLKSGGAVDPFAVEEGRRKIREYYTSHGYNDVQVSILEGTKPTDHGVSYLIHEGPKQRVKKTQFVGNEFVSSGRLKTQVKSKPPILHIIKGFVDREKIDADVESLTAYYRSFGYFQARVGRKLEPDESGKWSTVTFVIHEGPRYNVRSVRFMGNTKFQQDGMAAAAKLKGGEAFEQAKMERDASWLQELYGSKGYVFADVRPETVFLEEPGQVDLVYHIEEGEKWRVGRIFVHIGGDAPHTRIQTALNRCTLHPGEIMDIRELHASERRLMASSLFNVDQASNDRPKITYQIPEDADLGIAKRPRNPRDNFRGQSPDDSQPAEFGPATMAPPTGRFEGMGPYSQVDMAGLAPVGATSLGDSQLLTPPPVAEAADVHVYCEDYEHYLRWCEEEAKAAEAPALEPAPLDDPATLDEAAPAQERPVALPSTEPWQGSQRETIGGGRYRRMAGSATREDGNRVRRSRFCAEGDRGGLAWQTPPSAYLDGAAPSTQAPPYAQQPPAPALQSTNPYAALQIRGQDPGSGGYSAPGVQQAYATVPPSQPLQQAQQGYATQAVYGGSSVGATGPDSASIVGGQTTLGQPGGVQQAQYSSNLQPPAGSVYPQPLNPYGPLPGYSVDPTSPLYAGPPTGAQNYPEGTVDIFINGNETQTGRLMFGVGVNSNAGVVGNIVVDERNFDWTRIPTSWEDVRNGSALRGAGQRFRIDASPGSQVSRYLVSWQEPYLFDRPISLGLSGSYYTRGFRDWTEQRTGGRISTGYQWVDRDLTITGAYRGEDVLITNIGSPPGAVPELDATKGHNTLHGFRLSLINDTRDSAFLATQGHYFEIGGEQVIGSFDYPRLDADIRQYFLLHERPDHSGRHVLSVSSTVGYAGTHTPVYDRFFAGGFDTMRGFAFRGASPVAFYNGGNSFVQVGGDFQWLNSIQYLYPITADDMLHGVVFSDFGTVEPKVQLDDFRVAVGAGLRITVPAMGPAPIALDFAWAPEKASFDNTQVFSFSLGFSR